MDKMYRHQRYFYDFTRKYYLLGRDRLIEKLNVSEGDKVLEIGCGTGRNLAILAKKHPNSRFFGVDASAAMLETAQKTVDSKRLQNIELRNALADEFTFDTTFGLNDRFDVVFFSYSISMIPTWKNALQNALDNLKPGKSVFIVDFYDQHALSAFFRKILVTWLKQFHVNYPADLIPHLKSLEKSGKGSVKIDSIYRSYAFIAEFKTENSTQCNSA